MKKQYIFLIMIAIILYMVYLILTFSYKEYKINTNIEYVTALNQEIRESNQKAIEIIEYKKSKAYRNKILKEQQAQKNKAEHVVYLTTEETYNKFTQEYVPLEDPYTHQTNNEADGITDSMNVYQKWIYFLFKKDLR